MKKIRSQKPVQTFPVSLGPMFRYSIIQTRSFATSSIVFAEKTFIQKVRSAPSNKYDFGIFKSTSIFLKWLVSNPQSTLSTYQNKLLNSLKLPPSVKLSTSKTAGLSEIVFQNEAAKIKTPTLLVHGHAASGIFYHRDFEQLSQNFQKLYAIDFPDIGLSDRKPLKIEPTTTTTSIKKLENGDLQYSIIQDNAKIAKSINKVEDYYIESMEQWRQEHNFSQMNIVAHSFGGYISFKYCLKYPQHVKKLILVSPGGVERSIFSIHNSQTKGIVIPDPSSPHYYRNPFLPPIVTKYGFKLLKMLGPLGIRLISKYLSIRFSRGVKPGHEEQVKDLLQYTMNLFYQDNNSFDALKVLLNAQLLAPSPILDNLNQLKNPVYFMYGQHDWMNAKAGLAATNELQRVYKSAKFGIIKNAGHNVFLDNPDDFNKEVINYLREE